jgi:hypothetical protein
MENRIFAAATALLVVLAGFTSYSNAQQPRGERRGPDERGQQGREHERHEIERERYRTPHWVFDDRFHHNHYYPQLGYSVTVLPVGHVAVTFRGQPFFFHSGVWYRRTGPAFVVARPPVGIIVPVLPPSYSTVWMGGTPYYYANDVYYAQGADGYAVVEPPVGVPEDPAAPPPAQAGAPGAASPVSAGGTWYYCESSKTYYPYVSECSEGWRLVPASPPQPR